MLWLAAHSQGNNYNQNYIKFEGLAMTTLIRWNSWNRFACNVEEFLIKQVTDARLANGMKDAGYTYSNIDDCWHDNQDSQGFIHPEQN